jgi:hypothetical protein
MRWLFSCGILLVLAVMLLAIPASVEGPALVPISPGHGLSSVDTLALVPLLAAVTMLTVGVSRRRRRLQDTMVDAPWRASTVAFGGGVGLGLLFASVFPFFWWWAIGAALFTAALTVVTLTAAGVVATPRPDGVDPAH